MTTRVLILGIVTVFFGALLFLPQNKLRVFLGLKEASRLWARVAGFFGVLWVILAVAASTDFQLVDLSLQTRALLDAIRYYAGGIVIGLFFALNTKRREGCTVGSAVGISS